MNKSNGMDNHEEEPEVAGHGQEPANKHKNKSRLTRFILWVVGIIILLVVLFFSLPIF